VAGGSPLAIWPDTTTLYTRLHEGGHPSGRVLGAGVLRLSVGQFAAQLTTMRPTGRGSAASGLGALIAFGRFFAGEVLDSYGPFGRRRT
jgi:cholesterol oxidase